LGHNHHDDHEHEHYYDDSYLHSNQHVFLKHYLEMLEACDKGIGYIINQTDNDPDIKKFSDCLNALTAIKDANFLAWNLMKKIDRQAYDKIRSFDEKVLPLIEEINKNQEDKTEEKLFLLFFQRTFPVYHTWFEEVRQLLIPHI